MISIRISPFCELARWVLELQGIPYRESCHAPLLSFPFTWTSDRSLNVPVILAPDRTSEVRQFLTDVDNRARADEKILPLNSRERQDASDLIDRILKELAISVRQYAYANMLPNRKVTGARAQMLGDDPDTWLWGKPDHRIHILLMLFAHDAQTLSGVIDAERQAARGILDELLLIHSQTFPVSAGSKLNHEHFGFVDGLSQPEIAGYRPERDGANGPGNDISAGEFILGYSNEYFGQFTASPHLHPPDADPNRILQCGDLGRNGTYLVVRQMEQEVAGFWNMLRAQCLRPDGTPDPAAEEALAAKMFGRWRDGTPVTVSPDRDGGVLDRLNDFGFSRDAYGFNCPLGAHIRRANPRDTLLTDKKESITTVKRHRMIRRGRPYGPPVADRYSPDGRSRGLVFAALNANIERQFEFLQQAWISSPNFAGLYDEADPILGGRTENAGVFTMPRPPVRQRRSGIMSHVTVKGGAYFFMPGLAALRYLSDPGITAPNTSSNRPDAASGG